MSALTHSVIPAQVGMTVSLAIVPEKFTGAEVMPTSPYRAERRRA